MAKKCGAKRFKKPYDWHLIEKEWIGSPLLSLKAFSQTHKIPLSTLRYHFKVSEKKELIEKAKTDGSPPPDEFVESTSGAQAEERRRLYLTALETINRNVKEVLDVSTREFRVLTNKGRKWRSASEAGNLVLRAAEHYREFAGELQGIPREDEGDVWPLTKNFWPLPYQRDFIFDFPNELKQAGEQGFVFAFVGGVGSGKTHCGARKFGEAAKRNRGLPGVIYAPTYRMLEDVTKKKFIEQLAEMGLSFRYKATEKIITIFGDTPIYCRSMDDPQHLRGPEYAEAWIDEAFQMPTREPFDIIMGRVGRMKDAPEPLVIVTGTPNGLEWGYDILVEEAEEHHVRLYQGRTDQNIHIDPSYYRRLLSLYDPRYAEQELHGKFIDVHKGRAYWAFSRNEHIIDKDTYNTDLPLDLCVDFNVSPMCWNISQDFFARGDWVMYVQDEIHIEDTNTREAALEFSRRYANHKERQVRIFGDATGQARHSSTTRTDYEVISDILKEQGFKQVEIRVGRTNPQVTDRVNSVNAMFKNAKGEIRLFIHKKCKETIIDFERVAFKPGTRELEKRKRKDGSLTHHSDAVGYKVDCLYPVRKVTIGGIQQGRPLNNLLRQRRQSSA